MLCSFALSLLLHFGAFSFVYLRSKDARTDTAAEQPAGRAGQQHKKARQRSSSHQFPGGMQQQQPCCPALPVAGCYCSVTLL
jgi:hypothetical protein